MNDKYRGVTTAAAAYRRLAAFAAFSRSLARKPLWPKPPLRAASMAAANLRRS